MKQNTIHFYLITLTIAAVLVFTSCSKHDMWLTIVYQTAHKQFHMMSGVSSTLNECLIKGKESLQSHELLGVGTFECGLNCKSDHPGAFLVCDEVVEFKGN